MLRGTGDELVQAVIRGLRQIGFAKVIDIDEAEKAAGANSLREDIQIHDRSPVLVIDVKGINGHPSDDESRQAEKHAVMRIREWTRHDVQPLTIINHQRLLPPKDRHNVAYRTEIVDNASDTGLGLMTTWDLFRLLRNFEKLHWPKSAVQDIFYRVGRIVPVPSHYIPIGVVEKRWKPAVAITPLQDVSVGDTVAVERDDTFEHLTVTSIQIEDESVNTGPKGVSAGFAFEGGTDAVREGAAVFIVKNI